MILKPGTLLGPYEIVSPIDSGGMGSVFRARDTRLGRLVALKVLPVGSVSDERLLKRFTLEARAAASVTHPNVVGIHDVGEAVVSFSTPFGPESTEVRFLVEEYVEGKSLRRLLRSGRPPLKRIIEIATDVVKGLAAAHANGLIHRDLKPENILIDERGTAKIADFGLVRWIYPETATPAEGAPSPLLNSLTRTGFVVGTLGYMSPEQARGEPIGPPSDLFGLGIVLYEMLTDNAPFARSNIEESFRAILKEEVPPIAKVVANVPPLLAGIVERCLLKDPARRYHSAEEILADLERLRRQLRLGRDHTDPRAQTVLKVVGDPRSRREMSPLLWLGAAVGVVVAFAGGAVVGGLKRQGPSAPAAPAWESPETWRAEALAAGEGTEPVELAAAPDGLRLAWAVDHEGDHDLWIAPVRGGESRRVSGDEGGRAPFFTPDGRQLIYSSARAAVAPAIFEVGVAEGAPRRLVENGEEPSLSPDGRMLAFVRRQGEASEIVVAARNGESARGVAQGARSEWRFPTFTPDGKQIVFYDVKPGLDSLSGSARLLALELADPRPRPFEEGRQLDPSGRPQPLSSGAFLARSFGDRSTLLLSRDAPAKRTPFGAALGALAATLDRRIVVTRGEGGPLVLWRR